MDGFQSMVILKKKKLPNQNSTLLILLEVCLKHFKKPKQVINRFLLFLNQIPVLIEVFMPPVRERVNSRFVKKTVSLPAWLAAKADEDGVNCSKLFQQALINYLGLKNI